MKIVRYFSELLQTLKDLLKEQRTTNNLLRDIRSMHDTYYRLKSGGYRTPHFRA